jgi:hypothetical protein
MWAVEVEEQAFVVEDKGACCLVQQVGRVVDTVLMATH